MPSAKQQIQKIAEKGTSGLKSGFKRVTPTKENFSKVRKAAELDYSLLHDAFDFLTKPAKEALIKNGIHTPRDLARFSVDTIANMNGIGPEAIDGMIAVMKQNKLKFKNK